MSALRWKRDALTYPVTHTSEDGRFVIRVRKERWNIRPRPVTITKIALTDESTGERYEGFRIVRDAKAKAEELAVA